MNKVLKPLKKIGKKIYKVLDKCVVVPISTLVYKVQSKLGKESKIEKLLNKPNVLLYTSLLIYVQKNGAKFSSNNVPS